MDDFSKAHPPSAPAMQIIFELHAKKLQKKLVFVHNGNFSHEPQAIKEKDFTFGPVESNLELVPAPIGKIGQVVGFGWNGAPFCRVLIDQDVYHISAVYLKLALPHNTSNA
jgi:hypothetical protein